MFKHMLNETMTVKNEAEVPKLTVVLQENGKRTLYINGEKASQLVCESHKMNFAEISKWMTGEDQLLIDEMTKFLKCEDGKEDLILENIEKIFAFTPALGWKEAIKEIKSKRETDTAWTLQHIMCNRGYSARKK